MSGVLGNRIIMTIIIIKLLVVFDLISEQYLFTIY